MIYVGQLAFGKFVILLYNEEPCHRLGTTSSVNLQHFLQYQFVLYSVTLLHFTFPPTFTKLSKYFISFNNSCVEAQNQSQPTRKFKPNSSSQMRFLMSLVVSRLLNSYCFFSWKFKSQKILGKRISLADCTCPSLFWLSELRMIAQAYFKL